METRALWLVSARWDLFLFSSLIAFYLAFLSVLGGFLEPSPSLYNLSLAIVLFSYPHLISSYFRVYGTGSFRERPVLRLMPLAILAAVTILHFLSLEVLLLVFGLITIHHHIMQQIGLLKLSHRSMATRVSPAFSYLLPLAIALHLLSDPNRYQPPGGGSFAWAHLPTHWQPAMFYFVMSSVAATVAFEIWHCRKTGILLMGKYLQYVVFLITWFMIPTLSSNWAYVYVVGGIAHGWYYMGLCEHFVSRKDQPGRVMGVTSGKLMRYAGALMVFSLALAFFIEGNWAKPIPGAQRAINIVAITLTLSHYWFDAHIWKRPKDSEVLRASADVARVA